MKFISTIILIALLIFVISFAVSHFNSKDGVLGSIKNEIYKYKLEKEIANATSSKSLLKISKKSDDIGNPEIKIYLKSKTAGKARALLNAPKANKENETASTNPKAPKKDTRINKSKEPGALNDTETSQDYLKIIRDLKESLERDLQKTDANEKDALIKSAYKNINDNKLNKDFEKALLESGTPELKDLYFLNKLAEAIAENKKDDAKDALGNIHSEELLNLASLLVDKESLPERSTWLKDLEDRVHQIKALAKERKFYEAKIKLLELKSFLKNLNAI